MERITVHVVKTSSNVKRLYDTIKSAYLTIRFATNRRIAPTEATSRCTVTSMNVPEFRTMAAIINA